ncbi:hypothetical protein BS78_01G069600 [Paspalum vaginatum]|nr:hypothetical protein BS78_01G069600 [Paspalum vaginatum]
MPASSWRRPPPRLAAPSRHFQPAIWLAPPPRRSCRRPACRSDRRLAPSRRSMPSLRHGAEGPATGRRAGAGERGRRWSRHRERGAEERGPGHGRARPATVSGAPELRWRGRSLAVAAPSLSQRDGSHKAPSGGADGRRGRREKGRRATAPERRRRPRRLGDGRPGLAEEKGRSGDGEAQRRHRGENCSPTKFHRRYLNVLISLYS